MNLLTAKQVADKLACHVSFVWKLADKDPTFPKPVRLGDPEGPRRARVTRWVDIDVINWLTHKQTEVKHEDGRSGGDVHQDQGEEVAAEG